MPSTTPTHRVARGGTLILGGGYAGANVARRLGRRGATIVNPTNFTGELDPPTCQHALRQAPRLARNLTKSQRPYGYRTRGNMAALARGRGIAVLGPLRLRGAAGWLVARGYHLMALPFAARRPKAFALLWGPLVCLTVVATGNHYVFDIAAGLAAALAGYAIGAVVRRPRTAPARGLLVARPEGA